MERSHVVQGARSDEFLAAFFAEEDGEKVLRNVTVRSPETRERLADAQAAHTKTLAGIHADVHALAEAQVAKAAEDAEKAKKATTETPSE